MVESYERRLSEGSGVVLREASEFFDLADVQDLIEMLQLPLDLTEELDSSVREEYIEF